MVEAKHILPIYKVENSAIISMHGDVTIAYKVELPEIFTLSERDYEAYHQTWVKAIKLLPQQSIFLKQDWFTESKYKADYISDRSFLSRSSEVFFNERPFLDHECYIFLTQKPKERKLSSSVYSNILRKSIVPSQTISPILFKDFLDSAGQFERILNDSGFVRLKRLDDDELAGTANRAGIIERYCFLLNRNNQPLIRDIHVKDEIVVGDKHVELYTLCDTENMPAICGSRINYDKYSTDRSKFFRWFCKPTGITLELQPHLKPIYFCIRCAENHQKIGSQKAPSAILIFLFQRKFNFSRCDQ